ncbi:MAG TPA: alkaline phosphatase family protein [Pyrinomonadaceae bacterium]|nr:alkaline phosphatase family protein [Pyrinomonadaceae bacterium]
MPQKSKTARASKKSTKRKPEAKAPRTYSQKSRKATGTKSDRSRSTKRVTARGTKASAARSARSRSIKRVTARAAPVRFVPGGRNDNLEKIDHIVVLMMENRSFDHMLGYLKLEGSNPNVDGLDAEMSNSHNGTSYPVQRLIGTVFEHDPGHGADAVAQQLSNHNGGFVSNYASIHAEDDPALIMGYHNGSSVPVYDHLARNFCVCDRWFCSVPGATWPNRLYAVAGKSPSQAKKVPIYDLPSFVRHLDAAKVSWGWYAHDVATLRLIDGKYRVGHRSKFFWFDRRTWLKPITFLHHAASGNLPAVSWIDPNFVDYSVTGPRESNDDHPPSDVMAGQDLALKLYNAIVNSPAWKKTLLLIVYDEHGGFYDHVEPKDAPDNNPSFQTYGVRVPALVISPWVERGKVSHKLFDHTSIIKTILLRFCRQLDGTIPDMGLRVTNAEQLGSLLTLTAPREPTPIEAYQHLIERVAQWRVDGFKKRTMRQARGQAPERREVTEFQEGIEEARKRLRKEGLPEGQP